MCDHSGAGQGGGGIVEEGTNECCLVETVGGELYINCRNYKGAQRRAFAWSYDEGKAFGRFGWDETLVEPICQASMVRYTKEPTSGRNRVLFANPASTEREKMTVRLSYDECRSWAVSKEIRRGPSAYSDLAIAPDMTICCLYERGREHPYEGLTLARFNLKWLTDGADGL